MAITELFAHPQNPIPATGTSRLVAAADGVQLRVAQWKPVGKKASRGTVLVIQGRSEFIERWFETIQELRQRGFHVLAFDWRGQGGSDRLLDNPRKGHVRRFSDYQLDLAAIFTGPMQSMPKPHFGLSHSMGAALTLEAAALGKLPLARFVALAPMLGLSMIKSPTLAKLAAATLNLLGFGENFVPGGGKAIAATGPFAENTLTSDPVRYAGNAMLAVEAPNLAIGDPTIRWTHEAFRLMARMSSPNVPLKISVPVLVMTAGHDRVVSSRITERFSTRLKTGSALVIPQSQHEIVMEQDHIRAAFWAAFDTFIPGEAPSPLGE